MARPLTPGDRSTAAGFAVIKSSKLAAAESDPTLLSSRCADLESKLKEEKDCFDILDANFAELELRKFAAEKEVEKHKRVSDQLQDQLDRATEDITLLRARDQRAQERIDFLLEELRQKEQELAAKFVELKVENQDLKCAKRRAQEEAEQWKRKYCEVQVRLLELFDDNLAFRAKTGVVEDKEEGARPHCVIEVSDEDGGGKEPRADGVEMTSSRRTPVASGGGDNRKNGDTVPIGKLKRKRETDVIKKIPESNGSVGKVTPQIPASNGSVGSVGKVTPQIPASNGSVGKVTPQIPASNGSVGKVTPQQLEKRLRILTPVAIYDVRTT